MDDESFFRDFEKLLSYELSRFCYEAQLLSQPLERPDYDTCVALLRHVDEIWNADQAAVPRRWATLIVGLLWEIYGKTNTELSEAIRFRLIRMGFAPAAILVDSQFTKDSPYFSRFDSALSQIQASAYIARQLIDFSGKDLLVTDFQCRLWNLLHLNRRIGVSAPTSSGKSFVLCHKTCQQLLNDGGNALYVVPTLALVNQVTADFRSVLRELNANSVIVEQMIPPLNESVPEISHVFVVTQERALSGLRNLYGYRVRTAVFDEIQNIERFANEPDDRSTDLRYLIAEVDRDIAPDTTVIAGPRIERINELTKELYGEDAIGITDLEPPVANITFGLSREGSSNVVRLYVDGKSDSLVQAVASDAPIRFDKLSGVQYRDPVKHAITHLIHSVAENQSVIVFSPTKNAAADIAMYVATDRRSRVLPVSELAEDLAAYVAATVHEEYRLSSAISQRVAYHHGTVPSHCRQAIEAAFRECVLTTIVSTTTLIQGVNLPANLVIIRNPSLSGTRTGARLTGYEFSNLRGRAGRLLKDLVGRCIVLDEPMFQEESIDLASEDARILSASFRDRYEHNRTAIDAALRDNRPSASLDRDGDIVTYIRHLSVKEGGQAGDRLSRVGIDLDETLIEGTRTAIISLGLDPSILSASRHWDPLALATLKQAHERGEFDPIPTSIFALGFVEDWVRIFAHLSHYVEDKYEKYIGDNNPQYLRKILIAAQRWAHEEPLRNIVGWKYGVDEKEVDRMLSILDSTVPYSIPRLIGPIVMMEDPDSGLLSNLETGTYRTITREILDLGIAREVALRIRDMWHRRGLAGDEGVGGERRAAELVRETSRELEHWEQMQLRALGLA